MRMVANIIGEIQRAQKSFFNFNRDLDIIFSLSGGLLLLDEDTLYVFSKKCEPNPEPLQKDYFAEEG